VIPLLLLGCNQPKQPNILLISLDTVRADHLSAYGAAHATTPNIDRLAQHGVVFEHAFSQGNESAYSHATLFTGLYPSEVASPVYETYGVPDSATLLPEVLRLYGYETAGFIAGGHVSEGFGFNQGYDHFESQVGFASFWDTAPEAEDWLEARSGDKPWFVFLHSYDAHRPYMKPGPWNHLFSGGPGGRIAEQITAVSNLSELVVDGEYFPEVQPSYFMHPSGEMIMSTSTYDAVRQRMRDTDGMRVTDEDRAHVQAHYDGSVAYADLLLGAFLAKGEDQGWLSDTVIVLVSDHGEDLLDHGYMNHRTGLFDSCIRVPTIVSGPGFGEGKRVGGIVDALDIAPTILALAGATPPAGLPGRDLREVASGAAPPRGATFAEGVMDMVSVRTDTHKLVYHHAPLADAGYIATLEAAALDTSHFSLYDLAADPGEQRELLAAGEGAAVAAELRSQLVAWRRSLTQGTHAVPQSAIDPAVADQMRKHGYWEAANNEGPPGGAPARPPAGPPPGRPPTPPP
jgi:arylsulfatase A-like enzyme